ncbi:DUF3604 domain-containing protein [Halioglobus maricola]|uniref:DUF3604 domain-containing protein n=1 Tax=Halioglobus maricola TaxID=2601894 RepID=A0A5P9NHD6_9GAMM|nr:DUF3604 domain-containing protein [Halioglobus maricola]QFU74438.1 DUF3604 domain-containing protein [Halioglobus maricola]
MLKKFMLVVLAVLAMGVGFTAVKFIIPLYTVLDKAGPGSAPRDLALQNDSRVEAPFGNAHPVLAEGQPSSENMAAGATNLYWGELHLHTGESFDASMMGNKLSIEDAYRFATGDPLVGPGGETMQLSRPLDFVAITDHAEGFGTRTHCSDPSLSLRERATCWLMGLDNPALFTIFVDGARGAAKPGDPSKPVGVYQPESRQPLALANFQTCKPGQRASQRCYENTYKDWARYVGLANAYYEPGVLTTLIAYEFSPTLPDQGKHHRNIIFRSDVVPERAISSFDVPNAIELWKGLEATCGAGCDFLTIPHNPNKSWGLTYSRYTWDGQQYGEDDWRLRQKREPLAEIFQVKGSQECALGVGATDEECDFAQVLDPCQPGETTGCAFQTGFVRQGMKVGLELEREFGFNPLQNGFVAATDSHNSNPGDVEEWDYRGASGTVTSPALRRLREGEPDGKAYRSRLKFNTSGGLAAVWAPENTREAIFDALARRETYATSGPRVALRFFAGWGIDEAMLDAPGLVPHLEAVAVPMGSVFSTSGKAESPEFLVWAIRDPMDAPLQRIQMVKGWIDSAGKTHEKVVDIACADGLQVDPATGRCPDNGASVDLASCQFSTGSGATELKTLWRDPDYVADQRAFYYVRVLMNPTCRWSSFDAIRLGRKPPQGVPATIQERAWSSPIWSGD